MEAYIYIYYILYALYTFKSNCTNCLYFSVKKAWYLNTTKTFNVNFND